MAKVTGNRVMTGKNVTMDFPHVFEPYSFTGNDEDKKYTITILIDKNDTDTINAVNKAIENAVESGITRKWGGKKPSNLFLPLQDGDEKDVDKHPEYAGHYVVNLKSRNHPVIFNEYGEDISKTDPDEGRTLIYSGVKGAIQFSLYPYSYAGKNGVSTELLAIMRTEDAPTLNGAPSAHDMASQFGEYVKTKEQSQAQQSFEGDNVADFFN